MKSDQINELASAQGCENRFFEEQISYRILRTKYKSDNKPLIQAFFEKLAFGSTGCWFWLGFKNHLGYGVLGKDRAHRVAYKLFNGPIPKGLSVLHRCDVRSCVNPEHLWLGTQTDNMRDCAIKGRSRTKPRFGEQNHASKLTNESVFSLRKMRNETGISFKRLAEIFGVSTMTAYRACVGQSWRIENV